MQPPLTARYGSVPPAATRWRSCWCPEAVRGFAPHQELHGHRPTTSELFDDSFDNRDDSSPLDDGIYSPKAHLSCLVTAPARSWQCGVCGVSRLTPYWTAASRSLANGNVLVLASKGIRRQRAMRSPPQLQDHNPCRRWASPPSDTFG